jgi:hypothetical protein
LSREAVDDILVVVGGWSLEEEAQVGEDWAHWLVVDLHSSHELTEDDHIDHQWSGKERVLADVVGGDRVGAIHEDAAGVLVKGPLGVLNEWNILDDDFVVDVVVLLWVQKCVTFDGVIQHTSLGDLLGLEALVLLEVLAIVVTQVVVGDDSRESDAGTDQEVGHHGLETGLAGLEVGATKESTFLLSVLDDTWVERVLWRTIKVKDSLLNGSDAVDDGTGESNVSGDSVVELGDALDLWEQEHLGVGGPEHDDLLDLGLHVLDVFSDFVDAFLVGSLEDIVHAIGLVGGDELLVEHGWQWYDGLEILLQGVDEGWLKDVSSLAGLEHVHVADVPSGDLEVHWVDHGHEVPDWLVNILELVGLLIVLVTNVGSGALGERTMEVWMLSSSLGLPSLLLLVGEDTGGESGAIVASEADKHDAELGNVRLGLDPVADGLHGLGVGLLVPHWDLVFVDGFDGWSLEHCEKCRLF